MISDNITFSPNCKCGGLELKPTKLIAPRLEVTQILIIGECIKCGSYLELVFDYDGAVPMTTRAYINHLTDNMGEVLLREENKDAKPS